MQNNSGDNYVEGIPSPNTKINIVKQKYLPSEMEEIYEESVESDITSSIISKRLLQIKQNRQKKQKQSQINTLS